MTENKLPIAICIMGPTASGKTDLAIQLARKLPCDIISVDSAMVYRGMDIGTAKPAPEVLAEAPHRLIDILDPADAYSAAQFRTDALREMSSIVAAARIPILVGGTMLYYRSLQQGLAQLPSADLAVRAEIEAEAKQQGWPALHSRLREVDPVAAERIHPNDPQRIQRALEIYRITGESITAHQGRQATMTIPYRLIKIAVAPSDRQVLHNRIAIRFDDMLATGLIEEVEQLHRRKDLGLDKPAIRSVGYRQVWEYLDGNLDRTQLRERGVIATRQLAKRQFTWLRSEPNLHWFDPLQGPILDGVLSKINQDSSI